MECTSRDDRAEEDNWQRYTRARHFASRYPPGRHPVVRADALRDFAMATFGGRCGANKSAAPGSPRFRPASAIDPGGTTIAFGPGAISGCAP